MEIRQQQKRLMMMYIGILMVLFLTLSLSTSDAQIHDPQRRVLQQNTGHSAASFGMELVYSVDKEDKTNPYFEQEQVAPTERDTAASMYEIGLPSLNKQKDWGFLIERYPFDSHLRHFAPTLNIKLTNSRMEQ